MEHSASGTATEFNDFPAESDDDAGTIVDKSFEEQVNAAAADMTQDDKGNWVVPDGLPEEVAYAANLEKRRRDTQSAQAKSDQQNKALTAERDKLKQRVIDSSAVNLTTEQKEELADLKESNPDAWRAKIDEYETASRTALEEDLSSISADGEVALEQERRVGLLQKCLSDNPGLVLDDNVFQNDLPPRITSKLSDGKCTFEEFLEETVKFLKPATKIANTGNDEKEEPNLGKAGGGSTASETSVAQDSMDTYRDTIF